MNLFEQQAANRRRSWAVVAVFVIFLAALGAGFDYFVVGAAGGALPLGTIAALGIGGASSAASYFGGARAVLAASGATDVRQLTDGASDDERLKLRQLENVVEEMAIAAGLPRPGVYVVPDRDPNAFATGRGPEHASIAVTRGLLDVLNREELQGVVAHEMSHIRNLDIRLLTLIAALVGAVALLSQWSARLMRHGAVLGRQQGRGKGKKEGGALVPLLFAIWIAAMLLAPLLSRVLAMMVSRQREYLADATAAELTRNPIGLAAALEKIEGAAGPTDRIARGSAHLCIADPLGRQVNVKEGFWADLFASHPPMAHRIELLRAMALTGPRQAP
ncbi:MAG: M48 family metalloprotease [Vicinamibacterales bacterium]